MNMNNLFELTANFPSHSNHRVLMRLQHDFRIAPRSSSVLSYAVKKSSVNISSHYSSTYLRAMGSSHGAVLSPISLSLQRLPSPTSLLAAPSGRFCHR